jgi:hypothetical protein
MNGTQLGTQPKPLVKSYHGPGDVVASFSSVFERMEAQSLYPVVMTCPVDDFYAELEEESRKFTVSECVSGWVGGCVGAGGRISSNVGDMNEWVRERRMRIGLVIG